MEQCDGGDLIIQVETLNDHFELVQDLKDIYQKSYVEYLTELQGWESNSQEVGGLLGLLVLYSCHLCRFMT